MYMQEIDAAPIRLDAVVLECRDVSALGDFYMRLLGWQRHYGNGETWLDIISPDGGVKIAFQNNPDYQSPVWPEAADKQQMTAHLDFAVRDKEHMRQAVTHALDCGAMLTQSQYGGDRWTTLIDPAGHPFCFVIW